MLEIGNGDIKKDFTVSTSIDYIAAFTGSSLKSIVLPSHLKRIGVVSFYNLTGSGLTITFNMDAHLEAIAGKAFYKSSGITSLALPAVDALGIGSFQQCTKMTTINIRQKSNTIMYPPD